MPVMLDDAGEGATAETEDTGVDTLRAPAPPSVPLLDVPLTEATVEVKDVVLDHADHNSDDEDDDAALVDASVAAIAVSRDVGVEVQAVSLPYCRGRICRCAYGRWVACVIMAREANVAVYKMAFNCISRG